MSKEFEMSIMGKLNFFVRLQIKHCLLGIFINRGKYAKEVWKKYGHNNSKNAKTLMASNCELDIDVRGKQVPKRISRDMFGSHYGYKKNI